MTGALRSMSLIAMALWSLGGADLRAQAKPISVSPTEFKAACIPRLANFGTWPKQFQSSRKRPFVIGCLGDSNNEVFKVIQAGLKAGMIDVKGQPPKLEFIEVVKDMPEEAIAELNKVHVLFVPNDQKKLWKAVRALIDKDPILTISDIAGFVDRGGMVEFSKERQVRMKINLKNVLMSDLKISSQVLSLKKIVSIVK